MDTKTLILESKFERLFQEIDKQKVIQFFEESHQVGQVRYDFKAKDGVTYEIRVSTLDGFIALINSGTGFIDLSNVYVMKITYEVEVTKTYHIHE